MAQAPEEVVGRPTPSSEGRVSFECGDFTPIYYPDEVVIRKERNVKEEDAMCEGQYVSDHGSKNLTVHAKGRVLGINMETLLGILSDGNTMDLITEQWSGEVLVKKARIAGPVEWDGSIGDPNRGAWHYEYELDAVSTGLDEQMDLDYGIVQNPTNKFTHVPDDPSGQTGI